MRSNPLLIFSIFAVILILIDVLAYHGIKKLKYGFTGRLWFKIIYWAVPVLILLGMISMSVIQRELSPVFFFFFLHMITGTFFLIYIPKLVFIDFHILQIIVDFIRKKFSQFKKASPVESEGKKMTRGQFIRRAGLLAAGIPLVSIAYGIALGRFNFTVRKFTVAFSNLPKKFDGFRIVQISDYHLGSFIHHENEVEKSIELVNDQNPDLILFTGDFVNNVAEEADRFHVLFRRLRSKYGMYSILGNHDYGDYVRWKNDEAKKSNLQKLIDDQRNTGFDVLLNESRKLQIDEDYIEIVGVENWGLPPFPQYGNLSKALSNTNKDSFKILMSHDPTHWDEQVLGQTDIDLTFSGHTHGAQFGIEIPGWRWSPVNMRYKHWGGMYEEGNQKLYVNTGIGFIGFPGRIGMPPEIAVIELKKV
jgi:predicted MPP superfamily phosphohydrolase